MIVNQVDGGLRLETILNVAFSILDVHQPSKFQKTDQIIALLYSLFSGFHSEDQFLNSSAKEERISGLFLHLQIKTTKIQLKYLYHWKEEDLDIQKIQFFPPKNPYFYKA